MSAPDRHFSLYGHPQVLRYQFWLGHREQSRRPTSRHHTTIDISA